MNPTNEKTPAINASAAIPFRLRRDDDGTVWFQRGDEKEIRVNLHLCFPWSAPGRYLSLRDENKNELALVEDPAMLDDASSAALKALADDTRFVFTINEIESADPDFELRVWKVTTKEGKRRFQTKLDDWPRPLPDGSLLIRDIAGDLYRVADPESLDPKSRRILWAFMD
jgi:hypothetical protein